MAYGGVDMFQARTRRQVAAVYGEPAGECNDTESGILHMTDDAGATWRPRSFPDDPLVAVHF